MKYLLNFLTLLIFFNCNNEKNELKEKIKEKQEKLKTDNSMYLWNDYLCKNENFENLCLCNNSCKEYYYIELIEQPQVQKNKMIIINFYNSNCNISTIEFKLLRPGEDTLRYNYHIKTISELLGSVEYFCYQKVGIHSNITNKNIINFFDKELWSLKEITENNPYRGDFKFIKIIGKKNGVEKKWYRYTRKDVLFISKIKYLLDFCKIKHEF